MSHEGLMLSIPAKQYKSWVRIPSR